MFMYFWNDTLVSISPAPSPAFLPPHSLIHQPPRAPFAIFASVFEGSTLSLLKDLNQKESDVFHQTCRGPRGR